MDSILDAEMEWKSVLNDVSARGLGTMARRFIRINPDYSSQPPAMDAEMDQSSLQKRIRNVLRNNAEQSNIDGVARRLIASTFFFHISSIPEVLKSKIRYKGTLEHTQLVILHFLTL